MKIAYITDDLYPGFGGQAVAAEGHIEALLSLGHEVWVLAGQENKPSTQPEGLILERVPVLSVNAIQMHFALPDIVKLQKLLNWADIIHINNPALLGLIAMWLGKLRQKPVVLGVHTQEETATVHFQGASKALIRQGIRLWFKFFYRQVDLMVAPTPFAARMASTFSSKPSYAVSNGLRWYALPSIDISNKAKLKASYLGSEKKYLLSYVGRLASEKRPEGLLEILEQLSLLRQDIFLLIAGTGPMKATLEARALERGLSPYLHFAGFISHEKKFELLAASDLFLMPSPTELQNIASLEAMSQGCAIIAAKAGSSALSEMIEEEDCGLTYNLANPEAAARALANLLDDPEQLKILQNNALKGAKKHDTLKSARHLTELYESCINLEPPKNLKPHSNASKPAQTLYKATVYSRRLLNKRQISSTTKKVLASQCRHF